AGDVISVSVDTPLSDLRPYVELRDGSDFTLASDNDAGPDQDAFISHYEVSTSGSYYVRVGKYWNSSASGDYELRVERARGIELESDRNYQNDGIGGANALMLQAQGTHQVATVAGTVMGPQGSVNPNELDEDIFA